MKRDLKYISKDNKVYYNLKYINRNNGVKGNSNIIIYNNIKWITSKIYKVNIKNNIFNFSYIMDTLEELSKESFSLYDIMIYKNYCIGDFKSKF